MKLVTTKTSQVYDLRCYAAKPISSCSSTCIRDQESRSPKPSSSTILHQERANKVFEKQSS
jgi:hypothetical protein